MRDGFSSASYLNKYYSAAAHFMNENLWALCLRRCLINSRRECEGYKQLNREPRFGTFFFTAAEACLNTQMNAKAVYQLSFLRCVCDVTDTDLV
jgi:hypothetical protein